MSQTVTDCVAVTPPPASPSQVVTDKEVGSSHAVWTVDELRPPSGLSSNITEEDWKEIMRLKEGELWAEAQGRWRSVFRSTAAFAESRRTQSTQAADNSTMSFWGKYFELQVCGSSLWHDFTVARLTDSSVCTVLHANTHTPG